MEVKIIPVSGCLMVFLGVFTLGVSPLAIWLSERKWPKNVDEGGITTRSGTQIPWNEFTGIKKVITRIGRTSNTTEHYELSSSEGKVIVVLYRLENGPQVFDYIWRHLPQRVREPQR